jgi:hypothetical protein
MKKGSGWVVIASSIIAGFAFYVAIQQLKTTEEPVVPGTRQAPGVLASPKARVSVSPSPVPTGVLSSAGTDKRESLEDQIAKQRQLIAAIDAELGSETRQRDFEFGAKRFAVEQTNALLSEQLYALEQRISTQELVVADRRRDLNFVIAPDTSDIVIQLRQRLKQEEDRLVALQAQYRDLLSLSVSQVGQVTESMLESSEQQRAGYSELMLARSEAELELQRLLSEAETKTP